MPEHYSRSDKSCKIIMHVAESAIRSRLYHVQWPVLRARVQNKYAFRETGVLFECSVPCCPADDTCLTFEMKSLASGETNWSSQVYLADIMLTRSWMSTLLMYFSSSPPTCADTPAALPLTLSWVCLLYTSDAADE